VNAEIGACIVGAVVVWLWARASKFQLNVFSHRTLLLLAVVGVIAVSTGGSIGGDEWSYYKPSASLRGMDAAQWGVLALMLGTPVLLLLRRVQPTRNTFSSGGLKLLALGLLALVAIGYAAKPLYYGCPPYSCR
jgi:hypothetical protein